MKCGESDGGRNRSPEKVSTTLNKQGEKRKFFTWRWRALVRTGVLRRKGLFVNPQVFRA